MKLQKVLLSIICVVAVLLAFSLSAFAIGFKAEEKYNSVFVVTSGNALGSGFAVGENCIVTNAHVLGNPTDIVLTTYTGETYSAYLVGCDQDQDIAVLGVRDATFKILKVADYKASNTGDDVYAIGAPKSMAYTLTKGVISAKERKVGAYNYIQTDAAINEGNSGGPLLNDDGDVIGINTLKMSDSEGIGLAIPMEMVCKYIQSLNIETDENGNVSQLLSGESEKDNNPPAASENEGESGQQDENESGNGAVVPEENGKPSISTTALIIALCGSLILNAVLGILLVFKNKKNVVVPYDPRERTDFEIDILE